MLIASSGHTGMVMTFYTGHINQAKVTEANAFVMSQGQMFSVVISEAGGLE